MIHTPEISNYNLDLINKMTGKNFEDISYANDEADSIGLGIYMSIYLPVPGEFDSFTLNVKNEREDDIFDLEFDNVVDLINFLNGRDGNALYSGALTLYKRDLRQTLMDEKHRIFGEFIDIYNESANDQRQLTADMLRRIRDKADKLIKSDF